jgi:multiple sugar transport system permease protein
VFVSAFAAYALVRLRMPVPGLILSGLLAVAMFPLISIMVPLFQVMRDLGLLNTWWALILPYAVLSMPVCTMVLIAFFQDIPADLENAAMIDGCTRVGALFRVVVPLSAPGVFTAAILAFVNAWDEFLLALTLSPRVPSRTVPVGITLYQGEFAFPWPIMSAALVIAIVPVSILIAVFQERIVSGLTQGGMKG